MFGVYSEEGVVKARAGSGVMPVVVYVYTGGGVSGIWVLSVHNCIEEGGWGRCVVGVCVVPGLLVVVSCGLSHAI